MSNRVEQTSTGACANGRKGEPKRTRQSKPRTVDTWSDGVWTAPRAITASCAGVRGAFASGVGSFERQSQAEVRAGLPGALRLVLTSIACCAMLLWCMGCGSGFHDEPPGTVLSTSATSVAAYPYVNEDLKGPCLYDLRLPVGATTVAGTLVVFERGDTQSFYEDSTVQAAMDQLHFAMVFAHECDSQTTGDFQADASKGPGRILFAALSQLASTSAHPELGTGGVVLFGYSAAGVLTATLLNQQPNRVIGALEYIAGDVTVDIAAVPASAGASQVPVLILANAEDEKSGTTRISTYFQAGRAAHAPWTFGVQHATDHCCSLSTRNAFLPWITAVASAKGSLPLGAAAFPASVFGRFTCTPNETEDVFGNTNCAVSAATVQSSAPATGTYGWLPDAATGAAWKAWVLNPSTNP